MGLDLVTLPEFKAYAGISSTTQDDALRNIIPKVSQLVKSICRTSFVDYVNEPKTDVFKCAHNSELLLRELPVINIGSFEFSEDYGNNYIGLAEFEDFVLDAETSSVVLIKSFLKEYNKPNAFKVTYNAGYETLPEDLKLAVFDTVKYYLQHDVSVHSPKNIGSNTVQIEYILTAQMPAHIRRVLSLYTNNVA